MQKIYLNLLALFIANTVIAQVKEPITPFGEIPKADIELTQCEFETDAKAEVLFDVSKVNFSGFTYIEERQKRIKIFSDDAKDIANVEIELYSSHGAGFLDHLEAQTINYVDGKPQIVKVDKSQIYQKRVDEDHTSYSFAFPDVKKGSIIEWKYRVDSRAAFDSRRWLFQNMIPTRYSRISMAVPTTLLFRPVMHVTQPLSVDLPKLDNGHLNAQESSWAMENIRSAKDEPFVASFIDNTQHITFMLDAVSYAGGGFWQLSPSSWAKLSEWLYRSPSFGQALGKSLDGENVILDSAKLFKDPEQKIRFLYNNVKRIMAAKSYASGIFIEKTITTPWRNKEGSITEINLILYHLLKEAKINAYPLLVSNRANGKINASIVNLSQFTHTDVYVPFEDGTFYVLDASDKINQFNTIPANVLNTLGVVLDKNTENSKLVFMEAPTPSSQSVFVTGELDANGTFAGNVECNLSGYPRLNAVEKLRKDGDKKVLENLKKQIEEISIDKIDYLNIDADTLPLIEKYAFKYPFKGSADYIYLNTSLFLPCANNPFVKESRFADIDLSYRDNILYTGKFKVPAGFIPETLPANQIIRMPDQSVFFKRIVAINDNVLTVQYMVSYQKSYFFKENYPDFREFYRKMYEAFNESIVLKKG